MAATMHSFMAIKRHARPSEIAELTAYLAGPHGAMITGSLQTIDGGFGA
jgi:cyclic-di-GMP-binding biofilm dispersal mediator protein